MYAPADSGSAKLAMVSTELGGTPTGHVVGPSGSTRSSGVVTPGIGDNATLGSGGLTGAGAAGSCGSSGSSGSTGPTGTLTPGPRTPARSE